MAKVDMDYRLMDTWKEIMSQGEVWQTVLDELDSGSVVIEILQKLDPASELLFVGCGTSYYLAEAAAHSWMSLTGQAARALPASEVTLYPKLVQLKGHSVQGVVISRSGRTSEAVRAARTMAQEMKLPVIGITCAEKSELEAICHQTIALQSADEKSTVMSRSFSSMLIALQYLAARSVGNVSFIDSLRLMASQFSPKIARIAHQMELFVENHPLEDYVFLGQGAFHGVAREAALKVMEMSCSYSQFFHTLEFRHGPKAIVSPATCLTFFLSSTTFEAEVLEEMKELGATTIAICNQANAAVRRSSDLVVEYGFECDELALLAPYIGSAQLFGFFSGIKKNLTPDHPKNLTRVVILD
jgi:glucosamine--fructose-6-phosphate aminotransferase (isomerizing)